MAFDTVNEDIRFYNSKHKDTEYEILTHDENWTVFRGREIRKNDLEEFKKEIEENKLYKYYINKDGKRSDRIIYGDEINRVNEDFRNKHDLSLYCKYEICDDCNAKKGEYHLEVCDLEICPFCFGQLLSCDCVDSLETE